MANLTSLPIREAVVTRVGLLSDAWQRWLQPLLDRVNRPTPMPLHVQALNPTATPGVPQLYVKGTTLVVAYDDGGTPTYLTVNLNGAAPTWSTTVVAP